MNRNIFNSKAEQDGVSQEIIQTFFVPDSVFYYLQVILIQFLFELNIVHTYDPYIHTIEYLQHKLWHR